MKKGIIFYFLLLFLFSSGSYGSVTLLMRHHDAAPATQVTVPVKVRDFLNIISVQGTIQFDQNIATIVSVQDFGLPGMNASSFGTTQISNGKLTFSWFDASLVGVSLPDTAVIFSIKYNVIGTLGQLSALTFNNVPTPMEVVNNTFGTETLVLQNGAIHVQNTIIPANVTLKIDTVSGTHGSQVLVSVRGVDFTNINSLQGTIQFDPAVVSYGGIGFYGLPGLSASNFGTSQISSGKLTFSWLDNTLAGQNMANNSPLFSMIFNLIGNAGDQTILSFATAPTPLEVTDSLLNTLSVSTVNGKIRISGTTVVQTLKLRIDSVSGPNLAQVVVPVRAWQFHKIISMQGTISFNTSVATFASVEQFGLPGMDASNFGTSQVSSGKLMFSWADNSLSGQNKTDSSVIFAIRYNIVGLPGDITPLDFINIPTPVEFVDTTYNPINSILQSGRIRVTGIMTITTNNPSNATYCTGDSLHLGFVAFGAFNSGNSFILQMSNSTGSFVTPVIVSTISATESDTFNTIIPLTATNGNGYRFRVVSTNPAITGSTSTTNITILESPAIPVIPFGDSLLCSNPSNSVYTISPSAGATSYLWTINPSGAGVVTGTGMTGTVDWDNSFIGSAEIFVSAGNGTCQSLNSDTAFAQLFQTPDIPQKPFGDTILCSTAPNSVYSIPQISNGGYEWELTPAAAGTISYTDTSAVVDWNSGFSGTASIRVRGISPRCTSSYSPVRNVTVLLSPSFSSYISGDTLLCVNPSNSTYVISASTNATGYLWSITAGAGVITPSGTTAFVDWNNTFTGNVNVVYSATNGTCSSTDTIFVEIHSTPGATSPISGLTNACDSTSVTYSVVNDPNIISYTWVLPSGWIGTSTTNSIDVTTGSNGGLIIVTANNNCGSGIPDSLTVSITNAPAQPGPISGLVNVCEGNTITYSIDSVPESTSYLWALPSGWGGSSILDSIVTTVGNLSGNISVAAVNNCGNSPLQTIVVTVNPLPTMPVVVYGNTTICENTTQEYHVDSVPGAVSYVWSIPSTWTGSSTTDSISIIADYNAGNIVVYAVNSCGGGAAQQLWVTVQTPPSIPMLSWADTVACDSSNVSYGVIYDLNVDSFTWTLPMNWTGTSTISTMYAFAATNGGQVTVVENNSCGIGPPLVINVTINPLPIVTMAPFGVICDTLTSFILTGGSPAGGIYYGTGVYNDSLYNPSISGAGTYPITYVYTDTNSCASQAVADIQVDLCLQVNEFINPENSFEVYPNPFAGTISILTKMKGSFVVVNIVGEVVFSTETISNKASIDLSYLSPGIYFVQISSGQVVKTTKLVKE